MSTHNIPFSIYIKKKITQNYSKSARTRARVRNIRGKRAIRVLAIEVLLYKQHGKIVDAIVDYSN